MDATDDRMAGSALDAAMAEVLAAERRARAAVEECAREAERLMAAAHAREKSVAERAARRGAAVRAAMAARLAARLAQLEGGATAMGGAHTPGVDERRRLAAAVESLAAELTQASP
jgi:hypothetical protein